MNYELHHGDCLDVLRGMADASVDSIVTDPPYGLSFMGRKWDYDVPSVEIWAECLRVLKPGGHLLAFAGTRTQHRMACRIEDAGFEIRDMLAWVYSTGFPKSHNMDNHLGSKVCGCAVPYSHEHTKTKPECEVRSVRVADVPKAEHTSGERWKVLQQGLQEQGTPIAGWPEPTAAEVRTGEPGMEGRRDHVQAKGELQGNPIPPSASVGAADGSRGRLHHGASTCDGGMVRLPADADGSGASHRPRPDEQPAHESGAMAGQPKPQAGGAWPVCRGCGLPVVPKGIGTALKPALEPITMARKPLAGTVAANVLAHGTGGLNIDGCRIPFGDGPHGWWPADHPGAEQGQPGYEGGFSGANGGAQDAAGRWPANLLHDGSPEVVELFPVTGPARVGVRDPNGTMGYHGGASGLPTTVSGHNDNGGSAARFFYSAKASRKDRGEGNTHPTVKPTDLMRYLCRLVTPPGGTVLDPFMGSGSTGKAAKLEGFDFIGVEREAEYIAIARARIDAVQPQLFGVHNPA